MCLVPPARLSQVWRKVFLVRKASAPAHFKLLDEKRELIDEPEDGCPKGVISDADTDHNVFNEWGMYYKSPPNSGQPRNPFEMARARAPTVAAPPPPAAETTAAEWPRETEWEGEREGVCVAYLRGLFDTLSRLALHLLFIHTLSQQT